MSDISGGGLLKAKSRLKFNIAVLLLLVLFASVGCARTQSGTVRTAEVVPTAGAPTKESEYDPKSIQMPEASGTSTQESHGALMDSSNAAEGYVMIKYEPDETPHVVGITSGDATYFYTLSADGEYVVCPLQMGNGKYTVRVYEHLSGTEYSPLCSWTLNVELNDSAAPYLYPNQFVDYTPYNKAIITSFEETAGIEDPHDKVDKLFKYVAKNIDYDYDKAASVQPGYLPEIDETLNSGKGICFDYSALLAAMLRVQKIPARLQMGDLAPDGLYHAWNLVNIGDEWFLLDATLYGQGYTDENYTAVKNY